MSSKEQKIARVFEILQQVLDAPKVEKPVVAKAIGIIETMDTDVLTDARRQLLLKARKALIVVVEKKRPAPPPAKRKAVLTTGTPEEKAYARLQEVSVSRKVEVKELVNLLDTTKKHIKEAEYHAAQVLLLDLLADERQSSLDTMIFYLRQGINKKNMAVVAESLERLETVLQEKAGFQFRKLPKKVRDALQEGKDLVKKAGQDAAETTKYYLKQGIEMNNRDLLQQSIGKAGKLTAAQTAEIQPLLTQAVGALKKLDAVQMCKQFLRGAIDSKDEETLEQAIKNAKTAGVQTTDKLFVEAETALKKIIKKNTGWFGRKKKKKKAVVAVFGTAIGEAPESKLKGVPSICFDLVEYIKANDGLNTSGMFRVSGSFENIEAIKKAYDTGENITLTDVNDAGGALKQYLRELPEPLVPFALYDSWIAAGRMHAKSSSDKAVTGEAIRTLIKQLPEANKNTMVYLFDFLNDLASNSSVNLMVPNNIAIVFAPNLLRPETETQKSMTTEMPIATHVCEALCEQYDSIVQGV